MNGGWLTRLSQWLGPRDDARSAQALRRRPTLSTAFIDLAHGDVTAAEQAFAALLREGLSDPIRRVRAEVGLSAARLLQGRRTDAANGLLAAAASVPATAAGPLADALVAAGEVEAALDLLTASETDLVAAARPGDAAPLAVRRLRLLRRYRGARDMTAAVEAMPSELAGRQDVAAEALRQAAAARDEALLRRVEACVGPAPGLPVLLADLAENALDQGRPRDALTALARAEPDAAPDGELKTRLDRLNIDALIAAGDLAGAARRLDDLPPSPALALGRAVVALEGGDAPALAAALAAAVRHDRRRLKEDAPVSDLPAPFLEWLAAANENLREPSHWETIARLAVADAPAAAALRQTLACLFVAAGRAPAARGLLKTATDQDETGRRSVRLSRALAMGDAAAHPGPPSRTGETGPAAVDMVLAGIAGDETGVREALAELKPAFKPADSAEWATVEATVDALLALQAGRYDQVRTLIAGARASDRLARLDATPAPRLIFLAGYGWSGSSAVYDALDGAPGVTGLVGGGTTAHMNPGAETEPVIFDGSWGLKRVWDAIHSSEALSRPVLWNFLRIHGLGAYERSYGEHKGVRAARAARDLMGGAYIDAFALFIRDLADTLEAGDRRRMSDATLAPFHALTGRLARGAAAAAGATTVLVNNGVRAYAVDAAALAADAIFVSVSRDLADQYADQLQSNRYFRLSLDEFLRRQRSRRLTFLRGAHALMRDGRVQAVHDVGFEAFVGDAVVRSRLIQALIGAAEGSSAFDPIISTANVGIGASLAAEDRVRIQTFRQRARGDGRTPEGDPFARRPLGET